VDEVMMRSSCCVFSFFSALTLIVGWHEGHPAGKNTCSANLSGCSTNLAGSFPDEVNDKDPERTG